MFNALIQHLDLVDIPFQGQQFTWSNMQLDPLQEKIDWVFTSSLWTNSYPATSVKTLARPISDHVPFVTRIGTSIPKSELFRLENFWAGHSDFLKVVETHWNSSPHYANSAQTLSKKFKQV